MITTAQMPISGMWEAIATTPCNLSQHGWGPTEAAAKAAALAMVDAFEREIGGAL